MLSAIVNCKYPVHYVIYIHAVILFYCSLDINLLKSLKSERYSLKTSNKVFRTFSKAHSISLVFDVKVPRKQSLTLFGIYEKNGPGKIFEIGINGKSDRRKSQKNKHLIIFRLCIDTV